MSAAKHSSPTPARVKALAALLVVVVVGGIGAGGAWFALLAPQHDIAAGKPASVVIAKGTNTRDIAELLANRGVVPNALMFQLQVRDASADGQLKAGAYELTTGMEYRDVIDELVRGPQVVYHDVVIPEGFTARQIATRVAKQTGIAEDELLTLMLSRAPEFASEHPLVAGAYADSLEGFLFPATYRIKEGTSARAVVEMMLEKFDSEMAQIDLSYARSKNLTPYDVLIIASAIEREAQLDKERPKVASVIYNRLKAKMRLQLCATVLYVLPPGTDSLTLKDLETESPYNTYRNAGLPPGPISNPGAKSIRAAAKPPKSDYLYYVLTGKDGSHTFASTYDAFLEAKRRSERVFGE